MNALKTLLLCVTFFASLPCYGASGTYQSDCTDPNGGVLVVTVFPDGTVRMKHRLFVRSQRLPATTASGQFQFGVRASAGCVSATGHFNFSLTDVAGDPNFVKAILNVTSTSSASCSQVGTWYNDYLERCGAL